MNKLTLTDAERRGLLERAYLYAFPQTGTDPRPEWSALEGYVARIVVEAVDRERAAWATKVREVADEWDWDGETHHVGAIHAGIVRDLRGLLAADDTEGTP